MKIGACGGLKQDKTLEGRTSLRVATMFRKQLVRRRSSIDVSKIYIETRSGIYYTYGAIA